MALSCISKRARLSHSKRVVLMLCVRTKQIGEDSPEIADLYLAYGKALLENAIASSGVLGKEQKAEEDAADAPQGMSPPAMLTYPC